MQVVINGMFWAEPQVGSGQYLHNLLAQFATAADHTWTLVVPRFATDQLPTLPQMRIMRVATPFDRANRQLAKVWFEQIGFARVCRALRADVAHVPYFGSPLRPAIPTVVTVHDLIPLLLPEYRGGRKVQAYMRLAAASARRADLVIADSHHTQADVAQHLGIASDRIVVTQLAAADALTPQGADQIAAMRARLGLSDPYICYVGGFDARKNVALAVRAFARARQQFDRRVVFAIAGRVPNSASPLFPDLQQVIDAEGVAADVALLGAVSDADKAALLSGAHGFVFPSRYEGFGLPPLEAMQCGAAVLASATTSVGEVVADGGALLPPDDVHAWAAALVRVVNDQAYRDALRTRGRERARQFSWQHTAQQTLAVYQRLDQMRAQPLAPAAQR